MAGRGRSRSESETCKLCALKAPPCLSAPYADKPKLEPLSSAVIVISAGDPLRLSCWAKGNPAPTYLWEHPPHVPLPAHTGELTVDSATSADEGAYTCLVSNSMGSVSATFQVQVQGTFETSGAFRLRGGSFNSRRDVSAFVMFLPVAACLLWSARGDGHWPNLVPSSFSTPCSQLRPLHHWSGVSCALVFSGCRCHCTQEKENRKV